MFIFICQNIWSIFFIWIYSYIHLWIYYTNKYIRTFIRENIENWIYSDIHSWVIGSNKYIWIFIHQRKITFATHWSKSIPRMLSITWVYIYTMSLCQYHKSMSIPLVHVYTMSPCQFHKSLPIPCVNVYTMSPFQ